MCASYRQHKQFPPVAVNFPFVGHGRGATIAVTLTADDSNRRASESNFMNDGKKKTMARRDAGIQSWVVNWSERQKCFHVETVEDMLLRNRRSFEQQTEVDFVPMCFATSFKEANDAAEAYRQMRNIPLLQDQIPESAI
jgi:hypothetical protein